MVNSRKGYYALLDMLGSNNSQRKFEEFSNLTSNHPLVFIDSVLDKPKTENKLVKRLILISPKSIESCIYAESEWEVQFRVWRREEVERNERSGWQVGHRTTSTVVLASYQIPLIPQSHKQSHITPLSSNLPRIARPPLATDYGFYFI